MTCRGIDASHSTSETDARGSHYEFRCCSVTKLVVNVKFEKCVSCGIYTYMDIECHKGKRQWFDP